MVEYAESRAEVSHRWLRSGLQCWRHLAVEMVQGSGTWKKSQKGRNSCIFITLPLSYWQEHQSELVVKRVDSGVEKEDVFIICLQRKNWILWHAWAKERTWFQLGWTNREAVVLSESELGLVAYAFLLYSSPFLVLCYLLFLTGKKIKILPP